MSSYHRLRGPFFWLERRRTDNCDRRLKDFERLVIGPHSDF